jgi:hypothetical protein
VWRAQPTLLTLLATRATDALKAPAPPISTLVSQEITCRRPELKAASLAILESTAKRALSLPLTIILTRTATQQRTTAMKGITVPVVARRPHHPVAPAAAARSGTTAQREPLSPLHATQEWPAQLEGWLSRTRLAHRDTTARPPRRLQPHRTGLRATPVAPASTVPKAPLTQLRAESARTTLAIIRSTTLPACNARKASSALPSGCRSQRASARPASTVRKAAPRQRRISAPLVITVRPDLPIRPHATTQRAHGTCLPTPVSTSRWLDRLIASYVQEACSAR